MDLLYILKFLQAFYFHKILEMQSFTKIKPSPSGEITLSFYTDIGKYALVANFKRGKYVL